jgi:hypothetical protein
MYLNQLSELQHQQQLLAEQYQATCLQQSQANAKLCADIAQLRAENAEVRAANAQAQAENARLQVDSANVQAENARLQSENARLRAESAKPYWMPPHFEGMDTRACIAQVGEIAQHGSEFFSIPESDPFDVLDYFN